MFNSQSTNPDLDTTAESRSVSLARYLWDLVDAHSEGRGGRSEFFRKLATSELKRLGKLPGSPAEQITSEVLATVEIIGPEKVLEVLRRLRARAAKERGVAHAG